MVDKEVNVKVLAKVEDSEVDSLENQMARIKRQQLQLRLDVKTEELDKARQRIEYLKRTIAGMEAVPPHLGIKIDDSEITKLKKELAQLESKTPKLALDVEMAELEKAKAELKDLDNNEIDVNVNNIAAMQAIDQVSQGFQNLKQGASELGQKFGAALDAAGQYQMNETFLAMNIGLENARDRAKEIDEILRNLPGNDTILQGLLTSAVAKNASMTTAELQNMGSAAADYMAAMRKYGKTETETQQDLNNYILAGNTGEIERSPILASHVDKLKEAQSVEERTLALQQALAEEGYKGIASQDIYLNNQQKFNDMLGRGQKNLGLMFMGGTDAAMGFLIKLDEVSGGLVGLSSAAFSMASPIFQSVMGLGQFFTGLSKIKEGLLFLIPTQWAEATAGWASIGWIAVLIALGVALGLLFIHLYKNCDWFRKGVDNIVASIKNFVTSIVNGVIGAVNTFKEYINGIPTALQNCLNWAHDIIMNHPIIRAITMLGQKLAWAFSVGGLGQHSPGKIVQAMEQELNWTSKAIKDSSLAKDTESLGSSISSSWNPKFQGAAGQGGNNTINITVGSVDSEERIQEIVDIIRRALAWDNSTAGRTA